MKTPFTCTIRIGIVADRLTKDLWGCLASEHGRKAPRYDPVEGPDGPTGLLCSRSARDALQAVQHTVVEAESAGFRVVSVRGVGRTGPHGAGYRPLPEIAELANAWLASRTPGEGPPEASRLTDARTPAVVEQGAPEPVRRSPRHELVARIVTALTALLGDRPRHPEQGAHAEPAAGSPVSEVASLIAQVRRAVVDPVVGRDLRELRYRLVSVWLSGYHVRRGGPVCTTEELDRAVRTLGAAVTGAWARPDHHGARAARVLHVLDRADGVLGQGSPVYGDRRLLCAELIELLDATAGLDLPAEIAGRAEDPPPAIGTSSTGLTPPTPSVAVHPASIGASHESRTR